jgi:hypothetical protein
MPHVVLIDIQFYSTRKNPSASASLMSYVVAWYFLLGLCLSMAFFLREATPED